MRLATDGRSVGRSVRRSGGRSGARSDDRSVRRSAGRTVDPSVGKSVGRTRLAAGRRPVGGRGRYGSHSAARKKRKKPFANRIRELLLLLLLLLRFILPTGSANRGRSAAGWRAVGRRLAHGGDNEAIPQQEKKEKNPSLIASGNHLPDQLSNQLISRYIKIRSLLSYSDF